MVSRQVTLNWGPQEMPGDTCGCPDQENSVRTGWRAESCSVRHASVPEGLTVTL